MFLPVQSYVFILDAAQYAPQGAKQQVQVQVPLRACLGVG